MYDSIIKKEGILFIKQSKWRLKYKGLLYFANLSKMKTSNWNNKQIIAFFFILTIYKWRRVWTKCIPFALSWNAKLIKYLQVFSFKNSCGSYYLHLSSLNNFKPFRLNFKNLFNHYFCIILHFKLNKILFNYVNWIFKSSGDLFNFFWCWNEYFLDPLVI